MIEPLCITIHKMFALKLVTLFVLAVCWSSVLAEYTEEDIKNMKMIFCGVCKDEAVRKDLMEYKKCSQASFPEVTDKVLAIREKMKDNADECFKQVVGVLREYAEKNPGSRSQGEACFHNNVKKEDLVNCH